MHDLFAWVFIILHATSNKKVVIYVKEIKSTGKTF